MRILITGSSGMLGQALCKKLVDKNEVFGIDIKEPHNINHNSFSFYNVNILDRDLLIQKIEEINPEVVIHCAAYTDVDGCETNPEKSHQLNVVTTAAVAEGCKLTSACMVYISTDFVFDGNKKSSYTEKDKSNPISIYGKSKFDGETAVREAIERYLIIRTSWLFGGGGKNFVDAIIKKSQNEKELKVVNDQIGSPTYADDLAGAIVGLITNLKFKIADYKILNITNADSCTWYEFAKEIIKQTDIKGVKVMPILSKELNRPAARPQMSVLDNTEFCKIYGEKLPNWKDALKRYIKQRKG